MSPVYHLKTVIFDPIAWSVAVIQLPYTQVPFECIAQYILAGLNVRRHSMIRDAEPWVGGSRLSGRADPPLQALQPLRGPCDRRCCADRTTARHRSGAIHPR